MTTFDAPVFHWPIRVYYEDTDAGGVVYHAQYVKYLERARTEWLRAAGVEQDELLSEYGIVFAVTHIDIRYKRAARFNEALSVSVAPRQTGRARLAFEQSITRASNPDEPLAIATVEVACVAQARFRACAVPDFLITKLSL
ncbi:MAG TPA: tol-pal system-associated acyl-CoA thioesterase [Gammaproteobacteria bacterium]|nr:tol-pal system-associated acyl-CoA thioesterase [Gammaproteobacteria bacterium]